MRCAKARFEQGSTGTAERFSVQEDRFLLPEWIES